jgi:hypothetical protein
MLGFVLLWHDFSRAVEDAKENWALAPVKALPARREKSAGAEAQFFVGLCGPTEVVP